MDQIIPDDRRVNLMSVDGSALLRTAGSATGRREPLGDARGSPLLRVRFPARRIGDDQMAVFELRKGGEHFLVLRQTIDVDLHDAQRPRTCRNRRSP